MDPQTDLPDLIEDLEVNIDELLSTLSPLLPPTSLTKTSQSLPLLEKAKLHTLLAYAIESTLFSTLQLTGADAKSHPLFTELGRLKGYFAKIKDAEEFLKKQEEKDARARLDVGAAQRFIKHGLAGNERYDALRKERVEGEKARALEKARKLTNKKFDEEDVVPRKRAAEGDVTPAKKARVEDKDSGSEGESEEGEIAQEEDDEEVMDLDAPAPARKRGRPAKKEKAAAAAAAAGATEQKDTPTRATRSSAPKTRSEAFQALAAGSPAAAKGKGKGKGRGKGKGK
jgi:exosome complex protein LRP1